MALNMADLFEHAVDTFPERVALICRDRQVTYSGLEAEANRLAHHLAARGVGPGGHVGLYARNSIETVTTLLATVKLRAVVININYRYLAKELAYHLDDAGLAIIVHDQDLAPIVGAVAPAWLPRGGRRRRHGPHGAGAAHPWRSHGGHAGVPVRRGHGGDLAEVRSARGLGSGTAAPGQRAFRPL